MKILLLAALLQGAEITGGDYGGANLSPANGDELNGTFTNVGLFTIPAGSTVSVKRDTPLVVYASTIAIYGTLDGGGRGEPGGQEGAAGLAGGAGSGEGPGSGGTSNDGGGGGAGGGAGGTGGGGNGGAAGVAYGAAAAQTSPLSADDAKAGSGGGGGAGSPTKPGSGGGAGGSAVYLEASSMTITGSILVHGSTASPSSNGTLAAPHPAAGGGGGGGTILLRVTGPLELSNARLGAYGGGGGDVLASAGGLNALQPGGGGGGGRVKVFYNGQGNAFAAFISTHGGVAGGNGGVAGTPEAPAPTAGSAGTVSFGRLASAPTNLTPSGVSDTAITWNWTATPDWGDDATRSYRLYPATNTAPLPGAEATAAEAATSVLVTGLTPNTTYNRMLTARTTWGDSAASMAFSTFTLAAAPAANGFSAAAENSLTFAWTAPTNPSYTSYTVERALDSGFTTPATGSVVALSSAPAGLAPNTTYFFRARAVNLGGTATAWTATASTSTLAQEPSAADAVNVGITSIAFAWSGGANPAGTRYEAQLSADNFFSLTAASSTLMNSATFTALSPGVTYFFRVRAVNHNAVPTAYTAAISTRPGNVTIAGTPTAPGAPSSDRQFSYDGSVTFSWSAANSAAGIFDYHLIVGDTPGGSNKVNISTSGLSYSVAGLETGKTYYARVRAQSNGGVYGEFSDVSAGVPVFITTQSSDIPKPFNWPNPFNPANGPTQIGFFNPTAGNVTLKVYTLQGGKVYEETRFFGSGNQIFPWSAGGVAPGGYVGLLKIGETTRKFKMAVLY